jgi:hypothetical protein
MMEDSDSKREGMNKERPQLPQLHVITVFPIHGTGKGSQVTTDL